MKTAFFATAAFLTVASPAVAMTGDEFGKLPIEKQRSFVQGIAEGIAAHDQAFAFCLEKASHDREWIPDAVDAAVAMPAIEVVPVTEFVVRYWCGKPSPH